MKSRPILYNGPMVRALLDDSKTHTRRAWRDQPPPGVRVAYVPGQTKCPYGQPGDQLWVREAWRSSLAYELTPPREIPVGSPIVYQADGAGSLPHFNAGKLRPGIFMPRWASRITLEIPGVRVERLQDISGADAFAEGVRIPCSHSGTPLLRITGKVSPSQFSGKHPRNWAPNDFARFEYAELWESINGAGSWDANPWVWVVEFRRIK